MTPEDRELFQSLRRQQEDLRRILARLEGQLNVLEARVGAKETKPETFTAPAVPVIPPPPPSFPPSAVASPPAPPHALPPVPAHPLPPVPNERPSLEFQFGRWLTRMSAVFLVIILVLIFSLAHGAIFRLLGPGGILGLSAMGCVAIIIAGERLERRGEGFFIIARSLLATGLAGLYVTFYAAHGFDSVRLIDSPVSVGLLLLAWSAYVFRVADRKNSQGLAIFAIVLAYFSTAINPINRFTMAADLLLAGTAVLFLLRRGWAALSYLALLGTYLALLRRLLIDENGVIVLDTSRALPFAPFAVYLIGTWIIFTAAVLMSMVPGFRSGKRLAFLSLNNGALAGLLTLITFLAGYGYQAMGRALLGTGLAFLATSGLAAWCRPGSDARDITGAYLGQGLAVSTGGLMAIFGGITRGVLLGLEALFLGAAAAYSRDRILRACAYVVALCATLFLIWEIGVNARHPWLLGVGGAGIMFANAWWTRRDARGTEPVREKIVLSASYYCALALGLIAVSMATELSDSMLPPALALAALGLTFSIYLLPLYELPPLAQTLLLAAQALVLFPAETGELLPRWSTSWVAALTLVILAWWSRQRTVRRGGWIVLLNLVYAFALVGLAYHSVRPYVSLQDWMIAASFISAGFLTFGVLTRVWPLAIMGQLFLAVAVYHFFSPTHGGFFYWPWWAAIAPLGVVFATSRFAQAWLRTFPEMPEWIRDNLRMAAYGYQVLALGMAVRWIFGVVPVAHQIATFLFLGTLLMARNVRRRDAFGIRCSFVLSAIGAVLVSRDFQSDEHALATLLNGGAVLALLLQPMLLRYDRERLLGDIESWAVILISAATGWLWVGAWVAQRLHPHDLTMAWAIYALFLFFLGLVMWERRLRWCGLAILTAAIVRVFVYDIWGFSSGYKVLTLVVLTLIAFGVGFICTRFSERLKTWL